MDKLDLLLTLPLLISSAFGVEPKQLLEENPEEDHIKFWQAAIIVCGASHTFLKSQEDLNEKTDSTK